MIVGRSWLPAPVRRPVALKKRLFCVRAFVRRALLCRMAPDISTNSRPELLYVHDPLCGWCYGMSPVIGRVQANFAGRLDVSVRCGGLATGARAVPIADAWKRELRPALDEVEQTTGVAIGAGFRALVAAGRYRYDSEPPSRAIVAFRQLTQDPARTVAFARALQTAFFRDGLDLSDPATYNALLPPFGVEAVAFEARFGAPETAQATQQEFAAVARIGVQRFPTSIVRLGEQGYVLARGYQPYEVLRHDLAQLLAQAS